MNHPPLSPERFITSRALLLHHVYLICCFFSNQMTSASFAAWFLRCSLRGAWPVTSCPPLRRLWIAWTRVDDRFVWILLH